MAHHTLTASLPQHVYGYVDARITHGEDPSYAGQYEPCVIMAVTSRPSRCLHFEILCESGAKWANIPIHRLYWQKPEVEPEKLHSLPELQCWDCHGWDFALFRIEYLFEMGCEYLTADKKLVPASYLATLDHTDNGFSLYPPEHKNFNILLLEDGTGQIAAMPNNRIFWKDDSFVRRPEKFDYKVMPPITWHAEEGRRNPQETAITQDVE